MSPMWWTFLMVMFISTFLILMVMMYFDLNNKVEKKIELIKSNQIWKW
nr:ATP synthase F0 subunit 8 [Mitjaevia dworakowskae]